MGYFLRCENVSGINFDNSLIFYVEGKVIVYK